MSQGENKGDQDQCQEKEAAATAWGILIFGLIGATAATSAIGQLRRTVDWFYIQFSRSQSSSSWRNATNSSNHGGYWDEACTRYNQRKQKKYEEERERMERIRRMQNVFNQRKNEYFRSRMSWRKDDHGAYQHFSNTDTSFREQIANKKFNPWHSGNCSMSHYYSILGLDRSRAEPYSDAEIKKAFREKAMECHPDVNQDNKEAAEAKFKEVMMAYEAVKGNVVRIHGDEFWHMTKVLRLGPNDRVELFDGKGGLVKGCIQSINKTGVDIMVLQEPHVVAPQGVQWHVYAAFGTLKGGRADWLVEKCTELGASSVTPILTERSRVITENRVERLERVVLAAVKQCQRLHQMTLNPPLKFQKLLPIVSESKLAFLAAAEATPLMNILSESTIEDSGVLIVGPEGDFTDDEVKLMREAGATPIRLGPCRLRVETATIALLTTVMLWTDAQRFQSDL
ncbi:hypothetical protein Cni_G25783 [Canna indica]|uniref:16S rRNA (uracil(1498)-N(3))-methyltransferase n=1 Tax=Canna indica TaxID=4628 RepID=A0AAQ3QQR6_9LILI|nr:hypothetical protein Cni_G25783 [Canna indica]